MLSWDFFSESCQQSYKNPGTGGKLRKRLQLIHKYIARKQQTQGLNSLSIWLQIPPLNFLKGVTGKPRQWARWLWEPGRALSNLQNMRKHSFEGTGIGVGEGQAEVGLLAPQLRNTNTWWHPYHQDLPFIFPLGSGTQREVKTKHVKRELRIKKSF